MLLLAFCTQEILRIFFSNDLGTIPFGLFDTFALLLVLFSALRCFFHPIPIQWGGGGGGHFGLPIGFSYAQSKRFTVGK